MVVGTDGYGTVIWVGKKWWIIHPGRRVMALNRYPARELRRCDNAVTML